MKKYYRPILLPPLMQTLGGGEAMRHIGIEPVGAALTQRDLA
jgi:hypothetical protein